MRAGVACETSGGAKKSGARRTREQKKSGAGKSAKENAA